MLKRQVQENQRMREETKRKNQELDNFIVKSDLEKKAMYDAENKNKKQDSMNMINYEY